MTLARDYQPYGGTLSSSGSGTSPYGYTGEMADPSGLIFLRARYYAPSTGRFLTRDPWDGDANMPMSYNAWLYTYANPIVYADPSGMCPPGMIDIGNGRCSDPIGTSSSVAGIPYPSTENYNPRVPPNFINFYPSHDPLFAGAPGLPKNKIGAQNHVPGWNGTKNLCGLVSLAAIFYAYDHSISTRDIVDNFNDFRDDTEPELRGNGPGMQSNSELDSFVNLYYFGVWEADYQKDLGNLGMTVRTGLSASRYPMLVVFLDSSYGIIKPKDTEGQYADHWVVITGISREFEYYNEKSDKNWFRIYDPYRNQTMYYWGKNISDSNTNQGWARVFIRRAWNHIPYDSCGKYPPYPR